MKNFSYFPIYLDKNSELIDPKSIRNNDYSYIGLTHLLLNGFIPPPFTLYEKIQTIAPMDSFDGSYEYTDLFPKSEVGCYGFDEGVFENKVKEYLDRNVPFSAKVSILFSGGKDSTTLALLFRRLRPDVRVKLFFLNNLDEINRAKALSIRLEYELEVVDVNWDDVIGAYASMQYFCGDLSAPNYIVAQKNAEKWSSLIFDGSGNDLYSGHIPSRNDTIKYHLRKLVGEMPVWMYRVTPPRFRFLFRPRSLIFTYNYFPVASEVVGLKPDLVGQYKKYWKNYK